MKRYSIQLLVLCVSVMTAFCVKAQEQGKERLWSVGASYLTSTYQGEDEISAYRKYHGFNINGAYRLKIYKALNFHPGLSLYYTLHEGKRHPIGGEYIPDKDIMKLREFGIGLYAPIGLHFPLYRTKLKIDLETGPNATIYIDQRDGYRTTKSEGSNQSSTTIWNKNRYNRFMARWGLR